MPRACLDFPNYIRVLTSQEPKSLIKNPHVEPLLDPARILVVHPGQVLESGAVV